ncbi:MAG: alanine racemase [Candidatus Latescibacteria bacterium]|nr:alanine racemase [Candidatus Latescibacterota bacterium]
MNSADPISGLSSWCEVDVEALHANTRFLREGLAEGALLGIVVKSNGYGHDMVLSAREFLSAGADWLVVNSVTEARSLRESGVDSPVYVCGGVPPEQADLVAATGARVVVFDRDTADALDEAGSRTGVPVRVHLKVETGMHRQGLPTDEIVELALWLRSRRGVVLEGLTTHYANSDDTTDPAFALEQLRVLEKARKAVVSRGVAVPMVHSANSASSLLWPQTHGSLARAGIAAYGLWPSAESREIAMRRREGKDGSTVGLVPALSWRARVVQVKEVPAGGTIGYGRTYRAAAPMRVAVLPVGYFEGYDRRLTNVAHVLIDGMRAPVCGRVCMNLTVVDVTHIPGARAGSVATLLGRDGEEEVSADTLASWMGTINYEVVTRIHPGQPRLARHGDAIG